MLMNSASRAEVTITILSNIETVGVRMWLAGYMYGSDDNDRDAVLLDIMKHKVNARHGLNHVSNVTRLQVRTYLWVRAVDKVFKVWSRTPVVRLSLSMILRLSKGDIVIFKR